MTVSTKDFLGCVIVPLGRAPGSQSGGQGIDPPMVHHEKKHLLLQVLFSIKSVLTDV